MKAVWYRTKGGKEKGKISFLENILSKNDYIINKDLKMGSIFYEVFL